MSASCRVKLNPGVTANAAKRSQSVASQRVQHTKCATRWLSARATIQTSFPVKTLTIGPSSSRFDRNTRLRVDALNSNELRNGSSIEIEGAPYRVMEFMHVKPGKGSAFVRTKLKNMATGTTVDKTFRAGEPLQAANLDKSKQQFTYMDGDQFVFMNMETYEETRLNRDESWAKYLVEGMDCDVLTWNNTVIGVQPPINVTMKVKDTDPGLKGNTAQGGSKPATLESGAVIQVPLFVEIGDVLEIDTRTDTYLRRV